MFKTLVLTFITLFAFTQINAQDTTTDSQNNDYLNQNWLLADITYRNDKTSTDIPARYNIKKKVLELKNNNNIISIVPIKELKSLTFTEADIFLLFSYSENKLRSASHAKKVASLLKTKKKPIVPTPEDHYLNKFWQMASITFDRDKTLYSAIVRYNLKAKTVEVKQMDKTLTLPTTRVDKLVFTQNKETFVSLRGYDNKTSQLFGLITIFHTKRNLSLASYFKLKEASSLGGDIGYGSIESVEKSYKKLEEIYFIDESKRLLIIDKKTKKNSHLFGEHWENVLIFIKKEKLSFKTKEDIIRIIDFYSDLLNV